MKKLKNSAFSITVFTLNCELMIPGANGSTSDQREGTNPYKPLNYPTNPLPPMLCFNQTNVSFEICFSIWREANWDKATCFEWKCRWEIDRRLMKPQCSAITGNWLQIGRQLNFQSETSINLVNISASSSYIPMINTISNSHRLNCISPTIPCLLNLWNLVLVTHSVREFDGFR